MYKHAVVGGTFDHFHAGHKRILDFAFHNAENVTIGLTTGPLSEKEFQKSVEPYHIREEYLKSYLEENKFEKRGSIEVINDIYGPASDGSQFDSIVITRETKPNAQQINEKRVKSGLPALKILSVPFLKGKDQKIIRSTRIRAGLIDRFGENYLQYFMQSKQLNLPPRLRELLRKPLGVIIEGDNRFVSFSAQKAAAWIKRKDPMMVIAVGDIISSSLIAAKFKPDIKIIDYRSRRQSISTRKPLPKGQTFNPAGTIRKESVKKLMKALDTQSGSKKSKTSTIVINGEEDLLTLPAILIAPLGSVVAYGQHDLGIILVLVTEEIKDKVRGIIKQFE